MLGILTEKPSAARNFAKALGGMSGTYNGTPYTIVNARGHLYEYAVPMKQVPAALQAQYKSWNMQYLPWDETQFAWKRESKPDVGSVLTNIKKVLSGCDEIAIASDVDPSGEGQLLAWEILDELHLTRGKKISRFYFMDESAKEIQKAFVQRKPLPPMAQDPEYVKAEYRSQWDMLSMQFTRIATACVGNKAVLRQGRLKSVMVQLVGDGLKAVKEYKKVPFYMNKFKDENGVIYSNPDEPKFPNKTDVPKSYHDSAVVKDSVQMKRTAPPKLMDLAGLSSRLAAKGFKAKLVLDVYQKMYEAQIVSYPRTEDSVITPEQFNDLLPHVNDIAKVVGVDVSMLTHRTPRSTHVKTGGAHGANRPGLNVPSSLDDLKAAYGACAPHIYELLAKNYLAMLAEDYEYEQQKGHLQDYPKFTGSSAVPKRMGWKAVYNDDSDVDDDESTAGLGTMATPFIAEGANPKPPMPTMKWLMKQLEKNDVGTGATRTSTYAEVTSDKAKYPLLTETKGKLGMTEFGQMSYTLLAGTYIGDVKMTEQLQQQMRDIADGKAQPQPLLHQVREFVVHDRDVMTQNAANLSKEVPGVGTVVQKEKYTGMWNGKEVTFSRVWSNHRFTDEECEKLCAGETIVVDGLVSKSGKPYAINGKLSNLEYNKHKYVGFERLGFADTGKSSGCPDSWCGHTFSDDEKTLLEAGKTVFVTGFKSKAGKKFDANCRWDVPDDSTDGRKRIMFLFDK